MKVGFIGLGRMGASILTLLAHGGDTLDWSAIAHSPAKDAGEGSK